MSQETNRIAVIDLGTNTFHLVIFEQDSTLQVKEIYRNRHHVFLSKEGLETICDESIERSKKAVLDFQTQIKVFAPDVLKIAGTEGLRRASNGPMLKSFIEENLGAEVSVISGEREAELIARGVMWQFEQEFKNAIIMDIGGGSVEFIHLVNNEIVWLESFPVGVGVLYNKFQHKEPISKQDINKIEDFLSIQCESLVKYLAGKKIETLIGASGSFELIPSIQEGHYPPKISQEKVSLSDFHEIKNVLFSKSLDNRLQLEGLPSERAVLVVTAFVLMNWLINQLDCQEILISKYAVKEGLVSEYFNL